MRVTDSTSPSMEIIIEKFLPPYYYRSQYPLGSILFSLEFSFIIIIIIIILLSSGFDYGRFQTNRSTDLHSDFSFEYLDQMRIADRILGDLGS